MAFVATMRSTDTGSGTFTLQQDEAHCAVAGRPSARFRTYMDGAF